MLTRTYQFELALDKSGTIGLDFENVELSVRQFCCISILADLITNSTSHLSEENLI